MKGTAWIRVGLVLLSCKTTAPVVTAPLAVGPPAAPAPAPPMPKIALVLGGGAARGFAHVGVIRVLEEEKVPLAMVVGSSVGSLIAALYASDQNSFELEWTAFALEKDDLFDYGLMSAVMGLGPVKGDRLEAFVRAKVPVANIEQLKLPYVAVATDLNRGTRVVLDKGPVARAVHASCAIPGIFEPVTLDGRMLVDGSVLESVPIAAARLKSADLVVAVDISENVTNFAITNMLDVVMQSVNIMSHENVVAARKDADVLIEPAVGDVAMLDFTQKKRCMQAGIDAARMAMPRIRKAIETWQSRQRKSASDPRIAPVVGNG